MNTSLLILAWLMPLMLAALAFSSGARWLAAAAALPALAAALWVPAGSTVDLPWLLLGTRLGLDAHGPLFLGFASVLWLAAGLHAAIVLADDPQGGRFRLFYLLAMAGNFALIIGQDLMSFYFGFALMGLAAYGLVVHQGTPATRRAARIYLVMTLIGEVALFLAFLLLYLRTGSLTPADGPLAGAGVLELGLLTVAFGIKAGLFGLHMWLPLAHPAAPVPASAVLSGVMIKAAIIGWIRYLPLGEQELPSLGALLVVLGLAGILGAIVIGLGQRDPKVVLAYSSVSKMGTLIAGLGIAAMAPAAAPALVAALAFYAAHHGLAKGALFLGVGVVKTSPALWLMLMLPSLVLAGAPFTSGALAKAMFSSALTGAPSGWANLMLWMVPLSTLGTALLLGRFLYLTRPTAYPVDQVGRALAVPWMLLIAAGLAFPLLQQESAPAALDAWPVLLGTLIAWVVAVRTPPALLRWTGRIAPGDLIQLWERAWLRSLTLIGKIQRWSAGLLPAWLGRYRVALQGPWPLGSLVLERRLMEKAGGYLWLLLPAGLLLLLVVFP